MYIVVREDKQRPHSSNRFRQHATIAGARLELERLAEKSVQNGHPRRFLIFQFVEAYEAKEVAP